MNSIPMTIWNVFSVCSISLIKVCFITGLCLIPAMAAAQHSSVQAFTASSSYHTLLQQDSLQKEFPDPKKVLYRSLIIPGWGQITNKQAWKVPIVYGLLGGLSYYSIWLHESYKDYRAAYYNLNPNTPDDFKFGPTPDYISNNTDLNSLRENRNFYRNRRDFIFITIGLAYALNAIDAYVFAHLRSFDVSDDLSMRTGVKPVYAHSAVLNKPIPSAALTLEIHF